MKDILARELKGHNILAVERFEDSTRWMIEFVVLHPCSAYGSRGDEMRLFLAEDSYQNALQDQQRRKIKIKRYARVVEGHILDFIATLLPKALYLALSDAPGMSVQPSGKPWSRSHSKGVRRRMR